MNPRRRAGRHRGSLALSTVLVVLACAQRPVTPPVELTFLDAPSFDQMLSASLSRGAQVVAVNLVAPVSPNALPERLGKWLYAVTSRDGLVRIERDPRAPRERSFGTDAAIRLAILAYDIVKREMLYAPAGGYGVVVHVVAEKDRVTRLLFVRIPKG